MVHIKKMHLQSWNARVLNEFIAALEERDTFKLRNLLTPDGVFMNQSRDGFCAMLNQTFLDLQHSSGKQDFTLGTSLSPHPGAEVVEARYIAVDHLTHESIDPVTDFGRANRPGELVYRMGLILNDKGKISMLFEPHTMVNDLEKEGMVRGN
jgi:hypothetical protein